jgi:hypothetical protein
MRENNTMTNPEDRSSNPARVIDLSSYRTAKVRVEPESADFAKHADEAMALNDKPAPAAKHGPMRRGLVKAYKVLGMEPLDD